jgi:hypothetical protein
MKTMKKKNKINFSKGLASIRRHFSSSRSGSVLAYALVVLSLFLVIALGISSVSVIERKTSSATGKSMMAFQVADSSAEIILQKFANAKVGRIDVAFPACPANPCCEPSTKIIYGNISADKTYAATLYTDTAGTIPAACSDNIENVKMLSSIGTYSGTTRAIKTAVAGGPMSWTPVTYNTGWTNQDTTTYVSTSYAKDTNEMVYLRGTAKLTAGGNIPTGLTACGTAGGTIFCLPSGYRPSKYIRFITAGNNTWVMIRIDNTTGAVYVNWVGAAGTNVSLDGISFPTN